MNHWIFQANPDRYRLQDRLCNPNPEISWRTSRYRDEIFPGDRAYVWQSGKNRGLCATLKVETAPEEMHELSSELRYATDRQIAAPCWRVLATIESRFPIIPAAELRATPGLESLSIFGGFLQATNFRLTPQESKILDAIISAKLKAGE